MPYATCNKNNGFNFPRVSEPILTHQYLEQILVNKLSNGSFGHVKSIPTKLISDLLSTMWPQNWLSLRLCFMPIDYYITTTNVVYSRKIFLLLKYKPPQLAITENGEAV